MQKWMSHPVVAMRCATPRLRGVGGQELQLLPRNPWHLCQGRASRGPLLAADRVWWDARRGAYLGDWSGGSRPKIALCTPPTGSQSRLTAPRPPSCLLLPLFRQRRVTF